MCTKAQVLAASLSDCDDSVMFVYFSDLTADPSTRIDIRLDSYAAVAVPVPAALWLFASALGLLGWARRKRA